LENIWIFYIIIYSFLKGSRDGIKKAALKKSNSTEILFFYTLIGAILIIPFSKDAFSLEPIFIFYAFLKSLVVCTAWFFAFKALENMSVSLYGIMDLARMVFSTLLGVIVLNESFTLNKFSGVVLVILGLLLVNLKKNTENKNMTFTVLVFALLNCFFNAVSGTMDKVLMKHMTSSQLQFWFMLFMTIIYGIIILIKKERISFKNVKTNYFIPIMSLSLIVGDRFLFEANKNPLSQVTLMTVIKQSSVFVTVLTGYFVFKEKHILYKLFCCLIVLLGIFIALL
jgi:drug/metabolite transporter (DMT)-like permease